MSEKILFIKNRFEKVPVPELFEKTCLATVKRYVDDIFVYILKLKIFFALMTSDIIKHDVIFMITFQELESLKIHHRLQLHVLQPPVKFHDVVPNGKPETKRDISKTEAPFL